MIILIIKIIIITFPPTLQDAPNFPDPTIELIPHRSKDQIHAADYFPVVSSTRTPCTGRQSQGR